MSFLFRPTLLASASASLLLCAFAGAASAQDAQSPAAAAAATALPEITVTAPSPIVRRKLVRSPRPVRVGRAVPSRNREPAAQPQPAPLAAAAQAGVLPIVTDQFATVT